MKKINWKKYNLKQIKIIKILAENFKKNNFNFIHKKKYNHIRDILGISIALLNFKPIILDFGGSSISFYDLISKTRRKIKYFLFNPYFDENKINFIKKIKDITLIKKLNKQIIKKEKINFIYCNSVIQYIQNIDKFFFKKFITKEVKYILFTDTYITLNEKDYIIKQHNQPITIKVRNYKKLNNLFIKNNFEVVFKSLFKKEKIKINNRFFYYYLCNFLLKKNN